VIAGVKISDSPNSASVTGFEGVVEIYSSLRACAAGSSPSSDHTGVFSGSEMVGIEKQHRSYGESIRGVICSDANAGLLGMSRCEEEG
jgi:hypothetical protein